MSRRCALTLLGSTALAAACSPAIVSRDLSDPFEGGIGGTGIVGTLYGFSSLRINGLTVSLDGRTRYRTPFGATALDALAPGQVLSVSARRGATDLRAREVSVDYALVGVLRRGAGGMSVNGVPLIDAAGALGDGRAGARVAVSGVWTPGGVRPSRLDPAPGTQDLVAGTVVRLSDGSGIGGVPVAGPALLPEAGGYAVATGRFGAAGFTVERVQSGRFGGLPDLRLLSVEGYLEPTPLAPGFRIAGLGHGFARDVRLAPIGTRRALYFGRYDGLFGADRGYIVPDAYAPRARILETGLGEGFGGTLVRI